MHTRIDELRKVWHGLSSRVEGYTGLFMIGVISWTCAHLGDSRRASPDLTP